MEAQPLLLVGHAQVSEEPVHVLRALTRPRRERHFAALLDHAQHGCVVVVLVGAAVRGLLRGARRAGLGGVLCAVLPIDALLVSPPGRLRGVHRGEGGRAAHGGAVAVARAVAVRGRKA